MEFWRGERFDISAVWKGVFRWRGVEAMVLPSRIHFDLKTLPIKTGCAQVSISSTFYVQIFCKKVFFLVPITRCPLFGIGRINFVPIVNHPWGGGLVIGKSGPHYHNHSRFQQITFKLKQTFAVGGTKNVLLFSKQITFQSFIIKKNTTCNGNLWL